MDLTSSNASQAPKEELPLVADKALPKSSSKLPSLRASRKFAKSLTGSFVSFSKKESFEEKTKEVKAKAVASSSLDILSQCVALSDNIFGLYALEAWHFDEVSGKLISIKLQPQDEELGGGLGLVVKRVTQEADPENEYSSSDAIDAFQKLTDRSRKDYLEAKPTGEVLILRCLLSDF